MKIKQGYVMKKVGTGFVVVTVGQASKEFNGLIRLNPAGAFLWERIEAGAPNRESLLAAMKERYEDLEENVAEKDLDEFLKTVAFALEE